MRRILIFAALAAGLLTAACQTTGSSSTYDGPRDKTYTGGVPQASF